MEMPDGVEITGPLHDRFEEILTPTALELVALLQRDLGGRRTELLAVRQTRVDDLAAGVREAVSELAGAVEGTVGVVVPVARRGEAQVWLDSWSEDAGAAAGGTEARIAVLTGRDTKGLEFDGIVVVSPDEIESESATGRATLYVVLTRATQRMITLTRLS